MKDKLLEMLESRVDEMVAIRRHLHQHPELSFEEYETSKYIESFYDGKDVLVERIEGAQGILVTINAGKSEDVLALRGDFDALPIQEDLELDYKSKNDGVMHACGHDVHTAHLMVLADCLIQLKDEIPGTIKIIHQHAEETPPGGARDFLASGKLADVKRIYGLHVKPEGVLGNVYFTRGEMLAGDVAMRVTIKGKGGHGSAPHTANDAIVAASHFVVATQTIVSRRINPQSTAVITIGSFDGKGADNVIKETVELALTARYFEDDVAQIIKEELYRIGLGIQAMFSVTVTIDMLEGYPPLHNDADVVAEVEPFLRSASSINEFVEIDANTGSEDFSSYLREIPGAFFFVGSSSTPSLYPLHNPKFSLDEGVLLNASSLMAELVCGYFDIQ